MPKIRVLIIDDAVVIRRLVTDCLSTDPEIEVVGAAANGQIALAKIPQTNPDLVTLDVEMPIMDGLATLKAIRKIYPKLPVIMFSTLTERGASSTLDALALGANDYVTKPANVGSVTEGMARIRSDLIPKIKALCHRTLTPPAFAAKSEARPIVRKEAAIEHANSNAEILAIGVSTGGPNALSALMPTLTKPFPVPIVIVQHMPPLFTRMLAERLQAISGFPVKEGVAGAYLRPGEVWIAPGGLHMDLEKAPEGVRIRTHEGPPENSCRPAVDVLFRSVAKIFGRNTLGVILTGMGADGLRGAELIHETGGTILAQDEASSVVWGMPGAVTNAGLAHKVLPLAAIGAEINQRVNKVSAPRFFKQLQPA